MSICIFVKSFNLLEERKQVQVKWKYLDLSHAWSVIMTLNHYHHALFSRYKYWYVSFESSIELKFQFFLLISKSTGRKASFYTLSSSYHVDKLSLNL